MAFGTWDWELIPLFYNARTSAASTCTLTPCPIRLTARINRACVPLRVSRPTTPVNGTPAPVPTDEIESIRTLVTSTLPYDPCPTIKTGTMVEVVHGPLTGVVGRLTRKGTQARLILAVNLIGQGVSVQVDAADVRSL